MDVLPLQKVLYFEPCGVDIATSYLQGLARAEGYRIGSESVREVYSDTYRLAGTDIPSDTGPTTAHMELPSFDLRKAIHELQMRCTTTTVGGARKDVYPDTLGCSVEWPFDVMERERDICRLEEGDLLSYLDSCVVVPLWGRKEVRDVVVVERQIGLIRVVY